VHVTVVRYTNEKKSSHKSDQIKNEQLSWLARINNNYLQHLTVWRCSIPVRAGDIEKKLKSEEDENRTDKTLNNYATEQPTTFLN